MGARKTALEKLREVDARLEVAPLCSECGMRVFPSRVSVHECPRRRATDFLGGEGNLASAEERS